MKKSIRRNLFVNICLLVLFFVLLSWGLNVWYLEKYYLTQKKSIIKESQQKINHLYSSNTENIAIELERIENTVGVSILILDEDMEIKYSSFARILNKKPFDRRPPVSIHNSNDRNSPPFSAKDRVSAIAAMREDLKKGEIFRIRKDNELKVDFLEFLSLLDSGEILLLRVPLVSISESANIANQFLFFTGIVILFLGSLWAYIYSKNFTKPILEINHVAEHVANLDFTQKCMIEREDEVGELGKIINYLSQKLNDTITELNQKNQKLSMEIEKERKIDEMRKQFISNVSHELKTPISLIQGYAEGLKESIIEDEENKNFYCEVIIDEANKMDKLVKELLSLSQFEAGFLPLEKSNFDFSILIEQTLSKYQAIFERQGIQLEVNNNRCILVNADMTKIEQVLTNYLNNALNHVDDRKQIKINITESQEKVYVSVFNTGKHIPEESLDKIWTSFYKVDKARTRAYGGYGLGLSVVKAIQELHQNQFGVVNVDNGVLFWFGIDKSKNP